MAIKDELYVCQDCFSVILDDDYSAIEHFPHEGEDPEQRKREVAEAVGRLEGRIAAGKGRIAAGDPEKTLDVGRFPCQCCGETSMDSKYHCVILRVKG